MSNAAASPYAAPTAKVEDVAADPEAEAIRREHINHEASIKSVGILYYLGGVGVTMAGLVFLFGAPRQGGILLALLLVVLGVAQLFAGWGVRSFQQWARIIGCVLSAIGLLGFPFGTLINGYILYLFLSKKGRTIFKPEYQDIIAKTPHVKYKTSILVWIFLALLIGLLLLGVLAPLLGK